MRQFAFKLFEIVSSYCRQVSFINGGTNGLDSLSKRFNQIAPEASIEIHICFKPVQVSVSELNFHLKSVLPPRFIPNCRWIEFESQYRILLYYAYRNIAIESIG